MKRQRSSQQSLIFTTALALALVFVAPWADAAVDSTSEFVNVSSVPNRWIASVRLASPQSSKKEILARLKSLQERQLAAATELDTAIRKQLQGTLTMELKDDEAAVGNRRTNLVTKKIEELNKRRDELSARREIVDRLIFQVDSKLNGQPLQTFMEQTFIEMASADLADGRDSRLWKELTYLSIVMREAPEKNEDPMNVFESYLNFSNVLNPKTPAEYLASRNYTNVTESAVAQTVPRETLGDGAAIAKADAANRAVSTPITIVAKSPSAEAIPKTTIVVGPTPLPAAAPQATAPPTPIKAAREVEANRSARELTAPASETQLH